MKKFLIFERLDLVQNYDHPNEWEVTFITVAIKSYKAECFYAFGFMIFYFMIKKKLSESIINAGNLRKQGFWSI